MRDLDDRIEIGILPHGAPTAAIEVGKEVGAHSINAYHGSLNPESVRELREAGFKIYAWTVNGYGDIVRLLDLGIDGFITNYPDRVQRVGRRIINVRHASDYHFCGLPSTYVLRSGQDNRCYGSRYAT